MPFQSKAQVKAAFGGHLGSKMKKKAKEWADETPDIKNLPYRKRPSGSGMFDGDELKTGYKVLEKCEGPDPMKNKYIKNRLRG